MNGVISNEKRFYQIYNLENMRFGSISPTDVDLGFEKDDKLFVFLEIKHAGVEFKTGQRLFLERITNAIAESGRMAVCFLCHHSTTADQKLDVGNLQDWEIYAPIEGVWRKSKTPMCIKSAIDLLIDKQFKLAIQQ